MALTKQLSGGAIRFRWFRDKRGYELALKDPWDAERERGLIAGLTADDVAGMSAKAAARYDARRKAFIALHKAENERQARREGPYAVPGSFGMDAKPREHFDVALGEAKIFADLLAAGSGDQGFLNFCRKWGTFNGFILAKMEFLTFRKEIETFYEKKFSVADIAKWYSRHQTTSEVFSVPIGSFELAFTKPTRTRSPQMTWYARTMQGFIVLEVLSDLGGISEVSSCSSCGSYFTRSDLRGVRPQHCSHACRQRAYRRRQKTS